MLRETFANFNFSHNFSRNCFYYVWNQSIRNVFGGRGVARYLLANSLSRQRCSFRGNSLSASVTNHFRMCCLPGCGAGLVRKQPFSPRSLPSGDVHMQFGEGRLHHPPPPSATVAKLRRTQILFVKSHDRVSTRRCPPRITCKLRSCD